MPSDFKILSNLTGHEGMLLFCKGKLTAVDLVNCCLERIKKFEKHINAYAYIDPEHALLQAKEIDNRKQFFSQLRGIPIAVKDVIDTHDMPTQHNSVIYENHMSNKDAAVVSSLRALGAVIIGKTETHEFAAGGRLPPTSNPFRNNHTAGGSSSGSAAAVASGMAFLALGTQTAGSMLRPASFCGIFGMKPTFGVVSREGAKLYSNSLDTIGWYGRSVLDLGMLAFELQAIRRPLRFSESFHGKKFAIYQTPGIEKAQIEATKAVAGTASMLEKMGATVSEVLLPPDFDELASLQNIIMRGEGRAAFLNEYLGSYSKLSQDFRDLVEDSSNISFEALRDAGDHLARCRPIFDRIAKAFDGIICIGAPGEAPDNLNTTGDSHFQRMWTALHVPAIALPGFHGRTGLPIGIQVVSARYDDAKLIESAYLISKAIGLVKVNPFPI